MLSGAVPYIRTLCHFFHESARAQMECSLLDWEKLNIWRKISLFYGALSASCIRMGDMAKQVEEQEKEIEFLRDEVIDRLKTVNYNIFRIKIRSADAANSLGALKWELDKITIIKSDFDRLDRKLEYLDVSQQQAIRELKGEMPRIIDDLEEVARGRMDNRFDKVLESLDSLKKSLKRDAFELASQLASIVGILISLL